MCAEFHRRNLFNYDLWKDGRLATTAVGQDSARYIPGLYWLNYFSDAYLAMHDVDIERIGRYLRGRLERLEAGTLLQLYDDPRDWEAAAADVDAVLRAEKGFFSISDIQASENMTPIELTQFFRKIGKDWP